MNTNKLIALLPDMAAFTTIVEEGSFTKAADQLGMTPSGVSRQISRMEKILGVTLVERTTRKQTITAVGMQVYEQCRSMLENAKEALHICESGALEAKGRLRIASPKAFALQVLEPYLLAFSDRYPDISLHVQVTDLRLDPAYHDVDVIFHIASSPYEHLVCKPLIPVRSVLCASPDYLATHGLPSTPEALSEHSCLPLGLFERDHIWQFTQAQQQVKVEVDGRYINNHSKMRLEGVKRGYGIGIFPDFVVKEAIRKEEVIEVLGDWNVLSDFQGMAYMQFMPMKYMPNKIRLFLDFIEAGFSARR